MKKLWARIGRTYEVDDDTYEKINVAIHEGNRIEVGRLLDQSTHYDDGNCYLPSDCDDNPNDADFEF